MNVRGAGDRWMEGEAVSGVEFGLNETVEIHEGQNDGDRGVIILLVAINPEPLYLVALSSGKGDVRVRQSALRRVE